MHRQRVPALALILGVALFGCDRASPTDEGPTETPTGAENPTVAETSRALGFLGIDGILAGEDFIRLSWKPAVSAEDSTLAGYRIYVAGEPGEQDFTKPFSEVSAGATDVTLQNLTPGIPRYVVVRAVDGEGREDDNDVEWAATPNPVRYVSRQGAPDGDGLTPQSSYGSLEDAIGETFAMGGVNLYVDRGPFEEELFLFGGMMLYGGFDSSFELESRDAENHRTAISASSKSTALAIAPGQLLCGIDGFGFFGHQEQDRGILAEDCVVQITRVTVLNYGTKGIELRAKKEDDSRITGLVSGCTASDNGGEGIVLEGSFDLAIRDCEVQFNGDEGVVAEPLRTVAGSKSRVVVENCRVANNSGIGVNLKLEAARETGEKLRVTLRRNRIIGNEDFGANVDVLFLDDAEVDFRLKVEGNEISRNQKAGLHINGDAAGDYRIAGNRIAEQEHGVGVLITGDSSRPLYRLFENGIERNFAGGVRNESESRLWLYGCLIEKNAGPGVVSGGRGQSLRSVISDNSGASDVTALPDDTPRPQGSPFRVRPGPEDFDRSSKTFEVIGLDPSRGAVPDEGWRIYFNDDCENRFEARLTVDGVEVPVNVETRDEEATVSPRRRPRGGSIELRVTVLGEPWFYRFDYEPGS